MGRDAPFSMPKKNHSGTDLPPMIFHPTKKAATTTTSKSATTEHNDKRNNQPNVASPVKRRHFCSKKKRRNHRNHQTHDNRHNPNFEPALKGFEKERRGRVVNQITINKTARKKHCTMDSAQKESGGDLPRWPPFQGVFIFGWIAVFMNQIIISALWPSHVAWRSFCVSFLRKLNPLFYTTYRKATYVLISDRKAKFYQKHSI